MADGCFAPGSFSHQDHIGTAFELLKRYEFLEAAAVYGRSIKRFAESVGAEDKYNTTVTLAFLSLIAERMQQNETDFEEFLARNPDLNSRNLLDRWYSMDALKSETARSQFLMPDLNSG